MLLRSIKMVVMGHKNGGDGAEAMFSGASAGVAIEGTARAFVGGS